MFFKNLFHIFAKTVKNMSREIEEWRPIQGYEGLYEVSDWGRVKSLGNDKSRKEKILKGKKNTYGYLHVQLRKDGKGTWKYIHRLVAEAFLENPEHLEQVNHKDECKTNNCVENLEWCDRKYNMNYGTRTQRVTEKLRNDPSMSKMVDQIDLETSEIVHQWASTKECGRNGFLSGMVSRCARGVIKQYKGYVWKYLQA